MTHLFDYCFITLAMLIQNSIFPFAMEFILLPAGFLSYQGYLNFYLVIISALVGQLLGAVLNYFLALFFGGYLSKKFSLESKIFKYKSFVEENFILAFFIPVVRTYLSWIAGIFEVEFWKVLLFSFFGSFFWVLVVSYSGYLIGKERSFFETHLIFLSIFAMG